MDYEDIDVMRLMFWLSFYLLTLCMIDIEVNYTDGLRIKLNGWPNWIMRKLAKKELEK